MRILFDIEARANAAYDTAYHHKLRGAILDPVQNSPHAYLHNSEERTGLVFSNPFPWEAVSEGDVRHVLVASPREELLATIAAGWLDSDELNIGEMPFRVTQMRDLYPDVGEPGTTGVIKTATGVYAEVPPQYKTDDQNDDELFWRPEHSVEPFEHYVEHELQREHDAFAPDHRPGPLNVTAPLFSEWEFEKTYSLPVTVTTGTTLTMVLSKWTFRYEVRDDDHRRHLNLALDVGIGGRNGYGLGFLNIVERNGVAV